MPADSQLKPKELEALVLASKGYRAEDAGKAMGVTGHYVGILWYRAAAKLGADNKTQAVAMAIRRKIIE